MSTENEYLDEPEVDHIPHIIIQLKKALDTNGKSNISFQNGEKHVFSRPLIQMYLTLYMKLRPFEREAIQKSALESKDKFIQSLHDMEKLNAR